MEEGKVMKVLMKHNIPVSPKTLYSLIRDISALGFETAKELASSYSPSALGRMGHLGLRLLAQVKRDEGDEAFNQVMEDLKKVFEQS